MSITVITILLMVAVVVLIGIVNRHVLDLPGRRGGSASGRTVRRAASMTSWPLRVRSIGPQ